PASSASRPPPSSPRSSILAQAGAPAGSGAESPQATRPILSGALPTLKTEGRLAGRRLQLRLLGRGSVAGPASERGQGAEVAFKLAICQFELASSLASHREPQRGIRAYRRRVDGLCDGGPTSSAAAASEAGASAQRRHNH